MEKFEPSHLVSSEMDKQSKAIISVARLFGRVNNLDLEDFLRNLGDYST